MHGPSSSCGFSLVETMIALGVLTVGVLGAAGILSTGMQKLTSSPGDVVVMQKATEAIESVFSARDSQRLTWSQLQNVVGASNDGGIFLDGPQSLHTAGPDGLVGTTTAESKRSSCPATIRSSAPAMTSRSFSRSTRARSRSATSPTKTVSSGRSPSRSPT
jgi:Tfp pilus assembly protein PilV